MWRDGQSENLGMQTNFVHCVVEKPELERYGLCITGLTSIHSEGSSTQHFDQSYSGVPTGELVHK